MKISLIAAISKNNVIGKDNKLLWKLSTDMKFFKVTTTGHPIIMGRKTFESFGARPLPNRTNVVLTRDIYYNVQGDLNNIHYITHTLDNALLLAEKVDGSEEVFIIGGGEIYKDSIKLANKLYITHVDVDIDGDTYFPEIDPSIWNLVSTEHYVQDERNEYPFKICLYERK